MLFAERLRELRAKAGMTQEGLARSCGIPHGTLRNYEQGIREPSWRILFKLTTALGVDCRSFANSTSADEGMPRSRAQRGRPRKTEPPRIKSSRRRGRPRKAT